MPDLPVPSGASRPPLDVSLLQIRDLEESDAQLIAAFDCGDADLDEFLRDDAVRLQAESVTRVFLAIYAGVLVGYVALLADAIGLKTNEVKKLGLAYDDSKQIPALKVGRLACELGFRAKNRGLGEQLMRFAFDQGLLMSELAGCRLLTVDAYNHGERPSVNFYRKLGFQENRKEDAREQEVVLHSAEGLLAVQPRTLSMRFDLRADRLPDWAK